MKQAFAQLPLLLCCLFILVSSVFAQDDTLDVSYNIRLLSGDTTRNNANIISNSIPAALIVAQIPSSISLSKLGVGSSVVEEMAEMTTMICGRHIIETVPLTKQTHNTHLFLSPVSDQSLLSNNTLLFTIAAPLGSIPNLSRCTLHIDLTHTTLSGGLRASVGGSVLWVESVSSHVFQQLMHSLSPAVSSALRTLAVIGPIDLDAEAKVAEAEALLAHRELNETLSRLLPHPTPFANNTAGTNTTRVKTKTSEADETMFIEASATVAARHRARVEHQEQMRSTAVMQLLHTLKHTHRQGTGIVWQMTVRHLAMVIKQYILKSTQEIFYQMVKASSLPFLTELICEGDVEPVEAPDPELPEPDELLDPKEFQDPAREEGGFENGGGEGEESFLQTESLLQTQNHKTPATPAVTSVNSGTNPYFLVGSDANKAALLPPKSPAHNTNTRKNKAGRKGRKARKAFVRRFSNGTLASPGKHVIKRRVKRTKEVVGPDGVSLVSVSEDEEEEAEADDGGGGGGEEEGGAEEGGDGGEEGGEGGEEGGEGEGEEGEEGGEGGDEKEKALEEQIKAVETTKKPSQIFNLVAWIAGPVTASIEPAIVGSIQDQLQTAVAINVDDKLKRTINGTVVRQAARATVGLLSERLSQGIARIVTKELARGLILPVTQQVVGAVMSSLSHSLSMTLTRSLTRSPQQDSDCDECKESGVEIKDYTLEAVGENKVCNQCKIGLWNEYYLDYYTGYYTQYYYGYYGYYYTQHYAPAFASEQLANLEKAASGEGEGEEGGEE